MSCQPCVGFAYQLSVKASLARSRFVPRRQQDGTPLRIEGKGDSPHPVVGIEPQFFQVRMMGAAECINPRTSQSRPIRLQDFRMCQQLVLTLGRQPVELSLEGRMEDDFPRHSPNMTETAYDVKSMNRASRFVDRPEERPLNVETLPEKRRTMQAPLPLTPGRPLCYFAPHSCVSRRESWPSN